MILNPYVFATGGGDPYWANVSALLHMDGTNGSTSFPDATGRSWTAENAAQITTSNFKFGGASGLFTGVGGVSESGSRIVTADALALRFGTGDFTVETWAAPDAPILGFGAFYRKGQNTSDGLMLVISPTEMTLRADGTTDTTFSFSPLTPGVFHHFAFARESGLVRFFLDGVMIGSAMRTFDHSSLDNCYLGSTTSDTRFAYNGLLDELRITKGVARYTSNFTPPAAPFPNF